MNKERVIAGMLVGIIFTASYIIYFTYINPEYNNVSYWGFGIFPEGIGTVGMLLNFVVALGVAKFKKAPSLELQELVENIWAPGKLKTDVSSENDLSDSKND